MLVHEGKKTIQMWRVRFQNYNKTYQFMKRRIHSNFRPSFANELILKWFHYSFKFRSDILKGNKLLEQSETAHKKNKNWVLIIATKNSLKNEKKKSCSCSSIFQIVLCMNPPQNFQLIWKINVIKSWMTRRSQLCNCLIWYSLRKR